MTKMAQSIGSIVDPFGVANEAVTAVSSGSSSSGGGNRIIVFKDETISGKISVNSPKFIGEVIVTHDDALFSNATVSQNAVIEGGTHKGNVDNQGQMKNIRLTLGSTVNGGKVSGNIIGSASEDPLQLAKLKQVTLLENTQLKHVILGKDVIYPASGNISLGKGVKVTNIENLPINVQLQGAFSVDVTKDGLN